jgi:segregation and condensation protein A
MALGITSHQMNTYIVNTPVYEGPLDLLLQLIERAELDITKLALAQVTDQYLEHLHNMQVQTPEEVSAFLVIATKLVQIKSEALLPRPPVREPGEEDIGEALALQLVKYKRYRDIADLLARCEAAGLHTYLRLAPVPKIEGVVDLSGLGLTDLVAAAQSVLGQDGKPSLSNVVPPLRITIREKITLITDFLRSKKRITFRELLVSRRSRLDIVVTFLALLELVKRHFIHVNQNELFGEIALEATESWTDNNEFELEFEE